MPKSERKMNMIRMLSPTPLKKEPYNRIMTKNAKNGQNALRYAVPREITSVSEASTNNAIREGPITA